jgi:hypothetical protein
VDRWLAAQAAPLGDIARRWFGALRQCGPDVRELMHDGCPIACVEDAAFAYTSVFKAHVNLGFFQGAALKDPWGLLEGQGRFMRHVKLKPGALPNPESLEALVAVAYRDCSLRL